MWIRYCGDRRFIGIRQRVVLFILLSLIAVRAIAAPVAAKKDPAVEPTHSGRVLGRIYDAESGMPIRDAVVRVQQGGKFAAEGKTISLTDEFGSYDCQAILGRRSNNNKEVQVMNIAAHVFGFGALGLLAGSANQFTRRVDISRLNIRVTCGGYTGFEGIVPVRDIDISKFAIILEPILLTKTGSQQVSTVAEGWGVARIVSVNVEPSILKPGSTATVTVHVKCPPAPKKGSVAVECESQVFGKQKLDLIPGTTKAEMVFSKKMQATKNGTVDEILAQLKPCPYDIVAGGDKAQAFVQVVTTPAEENTAKLRLDAYKLRAEGKSAEALFALQQLCALPDAKAGDFEDTARLADQVHDAPASVEAWRRAVWASDSKERFARMVGYTDALVANGQSDRVIILIIPAIQAVKEKDRPKKVPASLMASVGHAYIQLGQLDKADEINAALIKYPKESLSETLDFRRNLRLAHAEAAIKSDPDSAKACGDYGNVLIDLGRWEEALKQLKKSVTLDPSVPTVGCDLRYALVHVRGTGTPAAKSFDRTLAHAEKAVLGKTEKQQSKDFATWHTLGMLLYRKASMQQQAGDATAQQTLLRVRESLGEALRNGRTGKDGLVGDNYVVFHRNLGTKHVEISGFAYPEANSDFAIMESLKSLETHPDDYLAYLNLAAALVELKQADLADEALVKCESLEPDASELPYIKALIAMQNGEDAQAVTRLTEVLKRNPRHSHANEMLAELYTKAGDASSAASCLAAHASYYGSAQ